METLTLTQKEQARLQILNSLLAEHMTIDQAATLLGVSTRHTWRLLAAYRKDGAAALAHGNRGRRPSNTTPEATRTTVIELARTRYLGANHTHLSELLREREGIDIDRSTLRRMLVDASVDSPRRRRPPKHRIRRQRMPRAGMLVQIDGSYHRWLGDDGPQFTLLLAVDDATGKVASALFCEHENTRDYFLLMKGLIQRYGIPIALYTDRHSVFKHVPGTGLPSAPTQFSRAMGDLGVQMIFALSPQAKGRVERTAGTFQDGLASELRLEGATNIEEANVVLKDFLVRFNERFGVPAQESEVAYRAVGTGMCLDSVICFKHSRRVARDNTVKYRWRTLQLLPGKERPSYAGSKVEVFEGLDGGLAVRREGRSSPRRKRRPVQISCAASLRLRSALLSHHSTLTAWADTGRTSWRHSTQRATQGMFTTPPRAMGVVEFARLLRHYAGVPRHFRWRDGRLYRRRSAEDCRFEELPRSWASIGARPKST